MASSQTEPIFPTTISKALEKWGSPMRTTKRRERYFKVPDIGIIKRFSARRTRQDRISTQLRWTNRTKTACSPKDVAKEKLNEIIGEKSWVKDDKLKETVRLAYLLIYDQSAEQKSRTVKAGEGVGGGGGRGI